MIRVAVRDSAQFSRMRRRSAQGEYEALSSLPLELQEALIIQDLLSILMVRPNESCSSKACDSSHCSTLVCATSAGSPADADRGSSRAARSSILLAGKYLDVIRECGIEVSRGAAKESEESKRF